VSFKKEFYNFLESNKRERNGLAVLACLMIGFLLLYTFMNDIFKPDFSEENAQMLENYQNFRAERELQKAREDSLALQYQTDSKTEKNPQFKKSKKELFYFDPNTTNSEDWKKLGFNSGQIKSIKKYLDKGGKFYKPEDLSKMYVISEAQFKEVESYIRINPEEASASMKEQVEPKETKTETIWSDYSNKTQFSEPLFININSADTAELKKLKGIGSYFAKKIVENRTKLGGYHSKEQLLEIWNFTPEKLSSIEAEIHIGNHEVKKIRINHCEAKELADHPYLNWNHANSIVNYRKQHGAYKSVEEITKSHLITEALCQKIKPYLTTD